MNELPVRRKLSHGVLSPGDQPPIVFVTQCACPRISWIANDAVHKELTAVWREATAWVVGRYVLMPDHIHYFVAPTHSTISLEAWAKYWKSQLTKRYRKAHGTSPPGDWQSEHWDTRLRSEESYEEKWEYVRNNPVRRGLVTTPDEWPFQGVIFDLRWGDQ